MFNLFKKKTDSIKVKDTIWMNSDSKWNGLVDLWKNNEDTIFVFWFDETLRQLQERLSTDIAEKINLTTAREIHYQHIGQKPVVFAEHYPLKKKEEHLFQNLHLQEVKVLSALDEPLFKRFGSDKIIQMMKQMGVSEKQSIEHHMITKAIQNAQEKMESKVRFDQSAQSQKEWLEKNLSLVQE